MGRPVYAADEAEAAAALGELRAGGPRPAGRRGPGPPPAGRRRRPRGRPRSSSTSPSGSRSTTDSAAPRLSGPGRHLRPRLVGHGRRPPGADPAGVRGLPRRLRAGGPARGRLHLPPGGLRRRPDRQRLRACSWRRSCWPGPGRRRRSPRSTGRRAGRPAGPAGSAVALAVVVLASAVAWGPGGRPAIHRRWTNSFHRFTWGAGIEAIRQQPGALNGDESRLRSGRPNSIPDFEILRSPWMCVGGRAGDCNPGGDRLDYGPSSVGIDVP